MKSLLRATVVTSILLQVSAAGAQGPSWSRGDDFLFLPDGRDLPPSLPTRMEGAWTADEMRIIPWKARLADMGDRFEGKVTVGDVSYLAPLTVQGTRDGDIVEFSVRFNEQEVSYFAGHVAGTSIVGVMEMAGKSTEWAGTWIDEKLTVETDPPK